MTPYAGRVPPLYLATALHELDGVSPADFMDRPVRGQRTKYIDTAKKTKKKVANDKARKPRKTEENRKKAFQAIFPRVTIALDPLGGLGVALNKIRKLAAVVANRVVGI